MFKIIVFIVTAYCPGECCCGEYADGYTADGTVAVGPIIAADPMYEFGTRMIVPGYGEAEVRDRGGAIKGNKLDMLFLTHQEALDWGVRELEVKVYVE